MIEQVFLAVVLRVVDGDTFAAQVPVWHGLTVSTLVRLNGIDTPELRGKCEHEKFLAGKAKDALSEILNSGKAITLRNVDDDKYSGRVSAQVFVDGDSVADKLIKRGLARPYDGGKRLPWCSLGGGYGQP
jgi:endonuclease YncB( thermonuclease family)